MTDMPSDPVPNKLNAPLLQKKPSLKEEITQSVDELLKTQDDVEIVFFYNKK